MAGLESAPRKDSRAGAPHVPLHHRLQPRRGGTLHCRVLCRPAFPGSRCQGGGEVIERDFSNQYT